MVLALFRFCLSGVYWYARLSEEQQDVGSIPTGGTGDHSLDLRKRMVSASPIKDLTLNQKPKKPFCAGDIV